MEGDNNTVLSSSVDISVKLENDKLCQGNIEAVTVKNECKPELSSSCEQVSGNMVSEEVSHIDSEKKDMLIDNSRETEINSVLKNLKTEINEDVKPDRSASLKDSLPMDILINDTEGEHVKVEKFDLKDALTVHCLPNHNVVSDKGEKTLVDADSKVTLKRKSDSLALISSYTLSSESDDDINRDAFLKPQVVSETDSDSDSESDGLPVFNVDSDVASESGDEGVSSICKKKKTNKAGIKAPGELDVDDLPPIKDLHISVKEEECLPFGKVHSIVETLVVIEALPDVPAINLESVLFTKIGQPLGEIFDVFGPVKRPYYTIRFNSRNDIESKSLSVGTVVYCAPKTKYTQYVFIHQLARMKGTDASWKGDLEPPPGYEDFSDDEQERKARKDRRENRIKSLSKDIIDLDAPPKKVPSFEERMNRQNTIRNQLFSNHLMTPPKHSDWFRNAAPGAGRPISEEGSGKGNVIRASNFTVPPFQRPPSTSPFPLSTGNNFHTPPPAAHIYPLRNNQIQPKLFSSPTSANIYLPQNYRNRNQFSVNRPSSSFSPNGQVFQPNGQGFQQNNSTYQPNGQNFQTQNFPPQNTQPFQRNAAPPFQPMVGGFQPSSQGWPSNSHTFGGQPAFSTSGPFHNGCPSFNTNNSPAFSQNIPNKHRSYDNQGLPPSKAQQFPPNSQTFSTPSVGGNFQSNGFMHDNTQFPPPQAKTPFPHLFQQNCSPQFSPQQSQNFQSPPPRPGNPQFSVPNNHPFTGNSPPYQSQNIFSPQNPPPPPASPFIQNNQFYPANIPPNFQQSTNPPFPPSCRSFPPN